MLFAAGEFDLRTITSNEVVRHFLCGQDKNSPLLQQWKPSFFKIILLDSWVDSKIKFIATIRGPLKADEFDLKGYRCFNGQGGV